ncbi:uncharacterized protein BXZ73DRAFT_89778 [Epithele typhae]|uniref:uncharacterized protein n=1 Tax=Epithele typhae TaxID=378194 RepID=UPI002007D18E|nr:uncharacterized protein BXZ73DRAFT_89778 [Epithele typhae]KAH9933111.1 hypothetical protein BXZ73DRAFT_89778 [Epithele typhae]
MVHVHLASHHHDVERHSAPTHDSSGILNLPGPTLNTSRSPKGSSNKTEGRTTALGKGCFHNHLSHHILVAYDLGASSALLEKVYEAEAKDETADILSFGRQDGEVLVTPEEITTKTWTDYLGNDKAYAALLTFFESQALEQFVFSPAANDNGAKMLVRFVDGVLHPLIQTGYGVEFGSDVMVAQAYDSDIMHPVMPYDPNAFITARYAAACTPERVAEIRRLSALWQVDASSLIAIDEKVEELIWTTTLLLVGSGRAGRKPRLDFFLMHFLNASLFVPSLLAAIPSTQSKAALLRALVPALLVTLLIRGRPRIDATLAMSYHAVPRPPPVAANGVNPPKPAVRVLYYGAQRYGRTPPGGVIGAFDTNGRETHPGMAKLDGSLFVRAAGVVMDTLGWVTHGQKTGSWDRSALGWDDAWKNGA